MTETLEPSALLPCPFCGGKATESVGLVGCERCAIARRDATSWNRHALASPAPQPLASLVPQPVAWRDVLAERKRQISAEGWSIDRDDQHVDFSLAKAAAVYALGAAEPRAERAVMDEFGNSGTRHHLLKMWPWDEKWWKPKSRRGDLVKAAALLLAEIERLDRARSRTGEGE